MYKDVHCWQGNEVDAPFIFKRSKVLPFYAVLQYIHALLFLDRSRTIQAAKYIVSLYLLKFALQTCISTAHSHFIANVRKKSIES